VKELDAFATNKPILYELADDLTGSRVLPDRWAVENIAIAIPNGREVGQGFLCSFTDTVKKSGARPIMPRASTRRRGTDLGWATDGAYRRFVRSRGGANGLKVSGSPVHAGRFVLEPRCAS
jgi:hypothetical protein